MHLLCSAILDVKPDINCVCLQGSCSQGRQEGVGWAGKIQGYKSLDWENLYDMI